MRKDSAPSAAESRDTRAAGRGEVRVIAGQWRSRKLAFPAAPGLRPTPDRVRETLFNWLGHDLCGFRCLDLYAGSGALGFEALSRGAEAVVMVERNPRVVRALEQSAASLAASRLEIVCADALEFLRDPGRTRHSGNGSVVSRFDVIFLDPPFTEGVSHATLQSLPPLLASGGLVYVESGTGSDLPPQWQVEKRGRAGQVHFQLMRWGPA